MTTGEENTDRWPFINQETAYYHGCSYTVDDGQRHIPPLGLDVTEWWSLMFWSEMLCNFIWFSHFWTETSLQKIFALNISWLLTTLHFMSVDVWQSLSFYGWQRQFKDSALHHTKQTLKGNVIIILCSDYFMLLLRILSWDNQTGIKSWSRIDIFRGNAKINLEGLA